MTSYNEIDEIIHLLYGLTTNILLVYCSGSNPLLFYAPFVELQKSRAASYKLKKSITFFCVLYK